MENLGFTSQDIDDAQRDFADNARQERSDRAAEDRHNDKETT
jgi:hypothetical protein